MDVPHGFDPTLILVLNLAGTFVFGLSGGLAAVRARLDLLGVVVLAAVVGLAVVLLALASRNWFTLTVVITVALHVFAGVLVWAFAHDHVTNFPFRQQLDVVEETLERGGALVTVRCTLPYRSRIESGLAQAGGRVIGYAPEVVYPVPAT